MKNKGTVEAWMNSNVRWILGVYNVEDFLVIPGTHWIIGSGLNMYGPGFKDSVIKKNYLHLFDADAETGRRLEPSEIAIKADTKTYPGSTPPDWETFGPHGISLSTRKGDVVRLFAVNHGGRDAVEVFEIDVSGDSPRFTWTGCLVAPEDGWPDAVCWLPDTDGVLVTAMADARYPMQEMKKELGHQPVGWVKEWNPKTKDWKVLPGTESFSAPNGIIVSEDGGTVWVNESTGNCVSRVKRGGSDPELTRVPLPGTPDNLRWSADGKSIFCNVHTASAVEFEYRQLGAAKFGTPVHTTFTVLRLDPDSMELEVVMPSGLYGPLGASCSTIEYGKRLWIGSCNCDRVAVFDRD